MFICSDYLGGVRSFVSNLSSYLAGAGIGHRILLYNYDKSLFTTVADGGLPCSTRIGFSGFGTERAAYRLLGTLIKEDDILICNDSLELEAINFLQLKNKTLFILHGDLEHYNSILKNYGALLDGVFCVSQGLKDKYGRMYPDLRFEVCHPLVKNVMSGITGREGPGLVAAYVGRFEYMKGADVFADVVRTIGDGIPVRWMVFTTTAGSDGELLKALPPGVEVYYDLQNEDLLSRVGESDLLIFPSRSEGFGMAVLEAMLRGVIPIARALPIGIPDMIVDGETGYLADDGDGIIAIMRQLSDNPLKRNTIRRQVQRLSNEKFDCARSGSKFAVNVKEMVSGPARKKQFFRTKTGGAGRLLPEFAYRTLKYLNSSIKHANK